jgi:hypothetical protein
MHDLENPQHLLRTFNDCEAILSQNFTGIEINAVYKTK